MDGAVLSSRRLGLLGLALSLWLWGCATQLAPAYDKSLVDGLNAVNADAMTLFASVAGGTKPDTFAAREDRYNATVGKLDALAVLAGARPVPKNKVTDLVNKLLEQRGTAPIAEDDGTAPSAHAIKRLSDTVGKMRDTDRKQGVTAVEVLAFKGQALIFFDQAITYENFLQR